MKEGDIVWIDYDVWLADLNELIETTDMDRASEHGIEGKEGPIPVIVGSSDLPKPLARSLLDASPDQEYEVEIPAEEAYGERDPEKVRLIPISKIRRLGIDLEEDREVEVDGLKGRIMRVTGTRVRIDFNHPYAGHPLRYRYRIVRVADTPEDAARGILEMSYGPSDQFDINLEEDVLTINVSDAAKYDPTWLVAKVKISSTIMEKIGVSEVKFIETFSLRKKGVSQMSDDGSTKEGEGKGDGDAVAISDCE